jgi:Asp-tRNA(Asn)/Glu-tRNA(Gln) amidotransferase A subunit family amidase
VAAKAQTEAELAFAGVAELGKALRTKHVSSVELAELFIGRLERLAPAYNALAALMADRAKREARRQMRACSEAREGR